MLNTESHEECVKRWEKSAIQLLVGRKIVSVRYMTHKEREAHGWTAKCVVIELDNGIKIYPSRDDEGNDAGALFTESDACPTLPVIRDYGR
jgi:hypothetical protein